MKWLLMHVQNEAKQREEKQEGDCESYDDYDCHILGIAVTNAAAHFAIRPAGHAGRKEKG